MILNHIIQRSLRAKDAGSRGDGKLTMDLLRENQKFMLDYIPKNWINEMTSVRTELVKRPFIIRNYISKIENNTFLMSIIYVGDQMRIRNTIDMDPDEFFKSLHGLMGVPCPMEYREISFEDGSEVN